MPWSRRECSIPPELSNCRGSLPSRVLMFCNLRPWNFSAPLSDMVKLQEEMTNVLVPQLEAITPGSGCYLNEVNTLLFSPPESSLSSTNPRSQLFGQRNSNENDFRAIPISRTGKRPFTAPTISACAPSRQNMIPKISFTPRRLWGAMSGRWRRRVCCVGFRLDVKSM